MNKKRIFFVCYGGGHIELVKALTEFCIDFRKYDVSILALTTAYNELLDDRVIKYKISDFAFLFDDIYDEAVRYGKMLYNLNSNNVTSISQSDLVFYLGISFFELVSQYGYDEAFRLYQDKGRVVFYPTSCLTRIIKYLSPNVVFTTNSPRMEAASIRAAQKLNIKAVQIIDLFGDDYLPPSADFIIVMNDFVKQKLEQAGINKIILPLGQPVLDKTYTEVCKINRQNLKRKFGINDTQRVLLFSPTKYYKWNEDLSVKEIGNESVINAPIFSILNKLASEHNLVVLIRPHPVYDSIIDYEKYLHYPYIRYYDNNQLNLYECIALSDIVLTYISTIAVQSVICGKVVFTYNYDEAEKYIMESYKKHPFLFSKNYLELESSLNAFLLNQKSLNSNEFYQSGATNRISIFVNEDLYRIL